MPLKAGFVHYHVGIWLPGIAFPWDLVLREANDEV